MNVAIVGCGNIFHKHVEAIKGNEHFKIIAVCDTIVKRSHDAAMLTGSRGFIDYREMIGAMQDKLDLVVICTWPSVRRDIAIAALEAGKNVLCEKPMALTVRDSVAICDMAQRRGRQVFEVKQNRYNKAIEALRGALPSLGKLTLVTVRVRWCRDDHYFTKDPIHWRGTWAHDGGVLASQACHHIDLLRYIGGKVNSVQAFTKKALLNIEAEDTGVAVVQFDAGHLGVIEATNAARPENLEASISVLGENGTITIGGTCANKIEFWNVKDCPRPEDCNENPPNIYGYGHSRVYEEVYKAILGQPSNIVTAEDALENIKLVNAIYDSSLSGIKTYVGQLSIYGTNMLGKPNGHN